MHEGDNDRSRNYRESRPLRSSGECRDSESPGGLECGDQRGKDAWGEVVSDPVTGEFVGVYGSRGQMWRCCTKSTVLLNSERDDAVCFHGCGAIRPIRDALPPRGFARLPIEQRRELASKGGKKVHAMGVGHEWTHEQAIAAGRKGGLVSRGGRGKEKP